MSEINVTKTTKAAVLAWLREARPARFRVSDAMRDANRRFHELLRTRRSERRVA